MTNEEILESLKAYTCKINTIPKVDHLIKEPGGMSNIYDLHDGFVYVGFRIIHNAKEENKNGIHTKRKNILQY